MKRVIPLVLAALLLSGCGAEPTAETTAVTAEPTTAETEPIAYAPLEAAEAGEIPFVSRFDSQTHITLSDAGITVDGGGETDTVYTSRDIVYYEDKDAYDSGNPYGEGTASDRHTAEEADAHLVVNITAPGTYRITGTLSAGQLRIDLGEDASEDPNAVVELILDNAHITCTVAPAILFRNVYECDGDWSTETASAQVDTTNAGANLVLEGENTVSGSYVAKIYKDNADGKKLWKQDGAIYSYMSMNVYGPGSLDLTAENEGLDTELHLTVNGGNIAIRAGNDGINTNEDGVSVTTINGGSLHIIAGLGQEGDGIDSNGYLVINGGIVVSAANPASDAGLDSDLGSYVNGGTVVALGSTMDWAESESEQVTMNLQFASYQSGGSSIVVTREDGTVIFAYDPGADEVLGENARQYQGAVISCANFRVGETYSLWQGGTVTGTETGGIYDVTTVTDFQGGTQLAYTGTDVGRFGGMGGEKGFDRGNMTPPDGENGQRPELPEGETMPEGFEGRGNRDQMDGTMPEVERPDLPDGETMPEGFEGRGDRDKMDGERPELPEGETMPEGMGDPGQMPQGSFDNAQSGTGFYMTDKVNAFSGVMPVVEATNG